MDSKAAPANNSSAIINLQNLANRYLDHYQKLVDLSVFTLSSFHRSTARQYDELSRQIKVLPHKATRMPFEKAKSTTEGWVLKHILVDALSSVLPLMEDCRTICALCDLKQNKGKGDPEAFKTIAKEQRRDFISKPIEERFAALKKNYGLESDVAEHIQSLMRVTMALAKEGVLTAKETNGQPEMTLKIRSVILVPNPTDTTTEGEKKPNLVRKISDNSRKLKIGDKINLSPAEQFGSLITMAIFASSMIRGVEAYARKTGAL